MIRNRRQYLDAVLWDQATGVACPDIRANWPSLQGLSKKDPRYKERVQEIEKLKNQEFNLEWKALREFLKT